MNVGLYFGSFNPVHNGHLIIANHLVQEKKVDELWFIVSPQNPFKTGQQLLNHHQRYFFITKAIEGEKGLRASTIEFGLPKPSYTIDTIVMLQEKYPEHRFSIVLGSDGFQNLEKWKNFETLTQRVSFWVYPRPGFDVRPIVGVSYEVVDGPQLYISSTLLRNKLKEGKSVRYWVPDGVWEELQAGHFYR